MSALLLALLLAGEPTRSSTAAPAIAAPVACQDPLSPCEDRLYRAGVAWQGRALEMRAALVQCRGELLLTGTGTTARSERSGVEDVGVGRIGVDVGVSLHPAWWVVGGFALGVPFGLLLRALIR